MSINIQPCTLCIRVYDEGKSYENKDKYSAVMTGLIVSDDTVHVQGAHGKLSKKDVLDIQSQLKEMGYTNLMHERHGRLTKMKQHEGLK